MFEHYMSLEHQTAIMAFIRRDPIKNINDQHEGASGMDVDIHPHTTTTNTNAQLEEISETIDVLDGGIQALSEDAQRLQSESLHLKSLLDELSKDVTKVKSSVEEQNTYLDGLKPNQEVLSQDIASLKQKVEDSQFVSYDGTFTWKIASFGEKMGEIWMNS